MREILFRGKRVDNGEWVEGDLLHGDLETGQQGGKNATYFISMGFGNGFWEVQPETVCQYTGLKDRNGTKIFEGDIVKLIDLTNGQEFIVVIDFVDGAFKIAAKTLAGAYKPFAWFLAAWTNPEEFEPCTVEVIGTKFDMEVESESKRV